MDPVRPVSIPGLSPAGAPRPTSAPAAADGGESFAGQLRRQLDVVNRMQQETERGVEDLLTGRSDNLTDVFSAARKAEVAFGLLMEIRNKLVDAYNELKNLRV
jgi:flagellar hook-basal body complex protein FliE